MKKVEIVVLEPKSRTVFGETSTKEIKQRKPRKPKDC